MAPNLEHIIRAMPGFTAGVAHGTDIGLVIALGYLTAEMTREDARAAVAKATTHPSSGETKIHAYAAGRLMAVAVIVAARFR
jgi:hypothetical protein